MGTLQLSSKIYNIMKMIGWIPSPNQAISPKGHGLEKTKTQAKWVLEFNLKSNSKT